MKNAGIWNLILIMILVICMIPITNAQQETEWMNIWIEGPDEVHPGEEVNYVFKSDRHDGLGYVGGEALVTMNHFEILGDSDNGGGYGLKCIPRGSNIECYNYAYFGEGRIYLQVRPNTPPNTIIIITYDVLWAREDPLGEVDLFVEYDHAEKTVKVVPQGHPVPEFPSLLLPASLCAGFVAATFCIHRIR